MNYRRNEDKWCYAGDYRLYNDVVVLSEVESSPTEPVNLTDFKVHARIDSADEDTYHTALLKQCRKLFERVTGIGLVIKTMTVVVRNEKHEQALPFAPFSTITSFVDSSGTAVISADYEFIDSIYLKRPVSTYSKIVYVTNPTNNINDDIKLAIYQLASFYTMHRGDSKITGEDYNKRLHQVAAPFKKYSWLIA